MGDLAGRRVLLFDANPDLATNPTLSCLCRALLRAGVELDIVVPHSGRFPAIDDLATRVLAYPEPATLQRVRRDPVALVRPLLAARALRAHRRQAAYDLIIGVDPAGIVSAASYAHDSHTPLVYVSFEIFFGDELFSRADRQAKEAERVASRSARLVVVQDDERAALLAAENGIAREQMLLVPVAPGDLPRATDTRWWHRRYGLSERTLVALHSGSFTDWTYAGELIENVQFWPEDVVLIVHGRERGLLSGWRRIADASGLSGRVVFSDEPVPSEQYEELVASADIGVVLYNPTRATKWTGKNTEHIGLASGKFAYCMKYGLPVVTLRQPTYRRMFEAHPCGIHVERWEDFPAAIAKVASGREGYREAAHAMFTRLSFDTHWGLLRERLLQLV